MDDRWITLTPRATLRFGFLGFIYTRPAESVTRRTFARPPRPNVLTGVVGREAFVRGFSDDVIIGMLGPNSTQERIRLAAYYLTDLAFEARGDEPLCCGEFMERYTAMYPCGQPGLPDDSVEAYVNNLLVTGAAPGSTMTQGARTTRRHDPTRECNVCVASASSCSESEPAPRHRAADAQRRARLDELGEARRQLDEELALLHQELGMDADPREQGPKQDIPVQEEPREGNDDQCERRPTADQPHDHAPMSPARGLARDNNRRANEGVNVDANADADAPPLFRRASQNLTAAAMLLRGCPEAATSEERRVRQHLKALLEAATVQQGESSASLQHPEHRRAGAPSALVPNRPPSQHRGCREGGGAATSAVRSRLGPSRDARNTIEARRRGESVDNHRDHRSCYHDDRGRGRCHDSDDDRDHSWSPNQRGPRAFGQSIYNVKFPSRFRAPTNVPRYDGDTNPSVWLEDYRLVCHAGGATDDVFIIKNLPLYHGDSARTWLEHLSQNKINDWTDLRRVFVGNFQGTYMRPSKQWELRNCKQ
jgi:hypothetical protein